MIARPFLLRRLTELHLVDLAGELALERDGIVTLPDLELAIAEERPLTASGNLRKAVELLAHEVRPLNLGRAWDLVTALMTAIAASCPEIEGLEPAGAMRRAEPLVTNLVVVAHAIDPIRAVEHIARLPLASELLYRAGRRLVLLFEGQEIDVRICAAEEYGTLLLTTTGPAAHVAEVVKRRGRRLVSSEVDLYAHAGLAYLPPEVRDAPDAFTRALDGTVPPLIARQDIRGDLHMHTTYSDGRDPLRHMVRAARALGYEYIAITDHSQHAGAARTLAYDQIARQRDEIARAQEQFPGMAVLQGLEVDIMPDGSLDCPDAILATLDIVLASLHDGAGQDRRKLTKRCLGAIRHPLVNVITHPANQLVGRRAGYDLDYAAVFEAAAETGTALEVDGAPSHLDLNGELARQAVQTGATLVIDSDCHRAPALERQMRMGVGTARRGWVEPSHVLNTRRLADVRAFVARKRAR